MELFKAARQWATRPDDERYWDVTDAAQAAHQYAAAAIEKEAFYADLRVEAADDDLRLVGKSRIPSKLSHHAFGQLASLSGAPASYLRKLPATLAAQNINHGLKIREGGPADKGQLLFHNGGGSSREPDLTLRAVTGERYSRIWNYEMLDRLVDMKSAGWRVPPGRPASRTDTRARPATEVDILRGSESVGGLKIRVGDMIAPSGVYVSDHNSFAFLVNEESRIDDGTPEGLCRGIMMSNSEVGAASLWYMEFLFKAVCGNHIVWGAQGVREIRVRHTGLAAFRGFRKIEAEIRRYSSRSASDEQALITRARSMVLGATKEEVLDALVALANRKRIPLTQKVLSDAVDLAETREANYGDPRTLWAAVNGLTELSQGRHADARVAIDSAAGRLMSAVVF